MRQASVSEAEEPCQRDLKQISIPAFVMGNREARKEGAAFHNCCIRKQRMIKNLLVTS